MDPIGLAFENFNALGMWRDQERKQPIDTAGKLITGETFDSVRELKHILVTKHRLDFYRCLADKFLTYALGRGMEYYDAETIDKIVQRLDEAKGRSSALLLGVIESAPFQKMRTKAAETASNTDEAMESQKETKRIANK
jgi:3-hydroxy-3-methylglutaryl CoA synthase